MTQGVLRNDHLQIGPHFSVSFQRTLRIPDDGRTYPLPSGLGCFPLHRVADFADRVPESWRERGGVFLPMHQREAMWLSFHCSWWRAAAVQVGIGKINAVSGRRWRERLTGRRQNYVVCPNQPWLDGINAGKDFIRQFVAMPLGQGYTVEGQLTGKEEWGGIQIRVVEPVAGTFPEKEPGRDGRWLLRDASDIVCCMSPSMGLGAGGRMRQKIYPDPHGIETWDEENSARVFVHIANSEVYREITGIAPPPTPISAEMYTRFGLPWFDLYDEGMEDVAAPEELVGIGSVDSIDHAKGLGEKKDASVDVPEGQVVFYGAPSKVVDEGTW